MNKVKTPGHPMVTKLHDCQLIRLDSFTQYRASCIWMQSKQISYRFIATKFGWCIIDMYPESYPNHIFHGEWDRVTPYLYRICTEYSVFEHQLFFPLSPNWAESVSQCKWDMCEGYRVTVAISITFFTSIFRWLADAMLPTCWSRNFFWYSTMNLLHCMIVAPLYRIWNLTMCSPSCRRTKRKQKCN